MFLTTLISLRFMAHIHHILNCIASVFERTLMEDKLENKVKI